MAFGEAKDAVKLDRCMFVGHAHRHSFHLCAPCQEPRQTTKSSPPLVVQKTSPCAAGLFSITMNKFVDNRGNKIPSLFLFA
jgi:hypothetical protein